jgi:hypothetical protein
MSLPAINTNIIVIGIIVAMGLYGLIGGKQRLRILILSVYVGIVLAQQFASIVAPMLHMLGPDQVSLGLLGLPIFLFGFFGVLHKKDHAKGAAIANIIIGILTGALIVSSAIQLLPTSEMTAVDTGSFLAMNLQQFHLWILGLLPAIVLLLGLMKGEKHH